MCYYIHKCHHFPHSVGQNSMCVPNQQLKFKKCFLTLGLLVPWHRPVIPAFGRSRQEDAEFEDSLSYLGRLISEKERESKDGGGTVLTMFQIPSYLVPSLNVETGTSSASSVTSSEVYFRKAQHLLLGPSILVACHCTFDTLPLCSLLPACSRVRTTFANTKT